MRNFNPRNFVPIQYSLSIIIKQKKTLPLALPYWFGVLYINGLTVLFPVNYTLAILENH